MISLVFSFLKRNFYSNLMHTLFFYIVLFLSFCVCMDVSELTSNLDLGVGLYWGTFVVTSMMVVDFVYASKEDLSDLSYLYYNFQGFNIVISLHSMIAWLSTQFSLSLISPLFLVFMGVDFSLDIYTNIFLLMLMCASYMHILGTLVASTTMGSANVGSMNTMVLVPLYMPVLMFGNSCLKNMLMYQTFLGFSQVAYMALATMSLFIFLSHTVSSFVKSSW